MVFQMCSMVATDGNETRDKWLVGGCATKLTCSSIDAFHAFEPRMGCVPLASSEYVRSSGLDDVPFSLKVPEASYNVVQCDIIFHSDTICNLS